MLSRIIHKNHIALRATVVIRHFIHKEYPRVLITGGCGQLGIPLAKRLWQNYGVEQVILSDIVRPPEEISRQGMFRYVDVMDFNQVENIVANEGINWIIHFAALLTIRAELNVPLAMKLNIEGVHNILEVARKHKCRLLIPSSIGAFGLESPRNPTPDFCIQRPRTVYGVSKVHNELMGEYFHYKYNLDFRCLRFPAVISADAKPEGGLTSYVIKMFHDAMKCDSYTCYLRGDTRIPMMWIDDCIQSVIGIMETPSDRLKQRTYNVSSISFTPQELAQAIQKHRKNFKVYYNVDDRQKMADSWPEVMDDRNARKDWNWSPNVTLDEMVYRVFQHLKNKQLESSKDST